MCISGRVQLRGPARLLSGPGAGVVVSWTRLPRCSEPACAGLPSAACHGSSRTNRLITAHSPGGAPACARNKMHAWDGIMKSPPPSPRGPPTHTHTPPLLRPSGPGSVIISTVSRSPPGHVPVLTAAPVGVGRGRPALPCVRIQTHALLCDHLELLLPGSP